MAEVIDIQHFKGGYAIGDAKCMHCGHEWEHKKKIDEETFFDCPECLLCWGHFKYSIKRDNNHWECKCGNMLFYKTDCGDYCPKCGVEVED